MCESPCSAADPLLHQTSLAARALDGLATPEQRSAVCDDLVRYLRTDTVW
jgi:chaperone required for assembly of F1-ATPase